MSSPYSICSRTRSLLIRARSAAANGSTVRTKWTPRQLRTSRTNRSCCPLSHRNIKNEIRANNAAAALSHSRAPHKTRRPSVVDVRESLQCRCPGRLSIVPGNQFERTTRSERERERFSLLDPVFLAADDIADDAATSRNPAREIVISWSGGGGGRKREPRAKSVLLSCTRSVF